MWYVIWYLILSIIIGAGSLAVIFPDKADFLAGRVKERPDEECVSEITLMFCMLVWPVFLVIIMAIFMLKVLPNISKYEFKLKVKMIDHSL